MTKKELTDKVGTIDGQKRQPCEVYSRVVGYLRPKSQWNKGKQAEYDDRKTFDMPEGE
jgi:ribonucleoside-triphosphate reductase